MDYLQEIAELREELRRHSIAYYDKDARRSTSAVTVRRNSRPCTMPFRLNRSATFFPMRS